MEYPNPPNSQLSPHDEFPTRKLQLASWLLASRKLPYLRCECFDRARKVVRWVFSDPDNAGPDLELDFERDSALVNAKSLFASQTFLRQAMSRTLENGEMKNVHESRPRR